MSSRLQTAFFAIAGAASVVVVAVLVSRGPRAPSSGVPGPASASARARGAPVLSASSPAVQSREPLPFVFDCAAFSGPEASACPGEPQAERPLLDLANAYRVSGLPCSTVLAESFGNAAVALQQVEALDVKKVAPLERALLQNAALELLSCSAKLTANEPARQVAARARTVIRKLALSAAESRDLPGSARLLPAWLGDGAAWRRGLDSLSMHTHSEGFARAHQQLQQQNTLADVVRLVLVDQAGAPFVSDVVQRVVQRRTAEDAVHVCIVELRPLPASCGPVALRPIATERGKTILAVKQTPACAACHANNTPRAKPYGTDTGFQISDASAARIQSALQGLLR